VTTILRSTRAQRGMTTAEYAVGTVAACGLGGLLLKILTSSEIRGLLLDVIRRAFAPVLG
jgi:hypothetical protein